MPVADPLTQKALLRLRSLAEGNEVPPDFITLIETQESTYTIQGFISLKPALTLKSRDVAGRIKAKGPKLLGSFSELAQEVETLKKEMEEGSSWLDSAIKELEKTPGHGWGHDDAHLAWNDKKTVLTATEPCPSCNGVATHPCPHCHGLGTSLCDFCQSRGQEICQHCGGRGHDPNDPNLKCSYCNGMGSLLCRHCNGTRQMPCPNCHGKGHVPCKNCRGTGFFSREVIVESGANLTFSLGPTSSLPSGLLRSLSRIGEANLYKGHADITLLPNDPEATKEQKCRLTLEAKIPYADIKVRFGSKVAMISCFGKSSKLSNVPPFLDTALSTARSYLVKAAKSDFPVSEALGPRLMQDALKLQLTGKKHPNHLRRLYPVGLSEKVAQEIMRHMSLSLKRETMRTRSFVAAICTGIFCALSAGYFFSPLLSWAASYLEPSVLFAIEFFMLMGMLVVTWLALLYFAQNRLRKQFPNLKVKVSPNPGKRGMIALGTISLVFTVMAIYVHNSSALPTL
ncbi:MAG: hypothetical protein EOM37_02480 [Proteobacteria bacterium]|nr:hypothetical protein [Alphaproteobacteria bacterium]NCC02903.1 hypothetical protein [Pseudomonadota bacterium]